jgi:carbonic anhydrase
MLRFTDSEMQARLRKETGRTPIAPARFYSFTDARRTPRSRFRRPDRIRGSRRRSRSGGSFDVNTGRLSEVFPDGETVTG